MKKINTLLLTISSLMTSTNKSILKFLVLTVVFSLCLSVVGCFKKDGELCVPQYIDESFEWFNCDTLLIDDAKAGNVDNSFPVFANAECRVFYNYYDATMETLGNVISYIDNKDVITYIAVDNYFSDCEMYDLKSCFFHDGNCYANFYSVEKGEHHNTVFKIDVVNSALEFVFEFDKNLKDSMYYVEKIIYKSGYYYVRLCYLDGNYYKNAFCVLDSQFIVVDEYDFTDEMIGWAMSDDNQIIVIQYDKSDLSNCHFQPVKLDIKTGAIDELTVDSDLLEKYIYGQMCISEDGYIYSANKELTISKMNLLTGEETIVADLNNTNIDLFDYNCSKLLYCDDVNIVLVKQTFYPSEPLNNVCYSLSKMDSNPNVGKQILYVAPYFKVNSLAGSAIKQMNETSDNTYIYVTMKYSTLIFDDYDNVNDSTINQYNRDIALLNVLKQDIRNGEGPDVLLDFGRFSALNDGEYLYNLLSVVNDSSRFNRDDYFENIFDAFIKEDALYQMPVSVCIGGVYADESATNGAGFTYEEFIDYIGTACNGADPLEFEFGRDRCFYVMIKSSYNELYGNNHTFSANSDSFRSICKYVSTMNEQASLAINTNAASFQEFNRIHFDLSKLIIKDDRQLYGMPSISGDKGPIVFPYESVGITTCTSQFDSAFEFVNSLLSKDVQADNVSHNPINKEAFEYYAEDAIRYSNKYILENYGLYDYYDESIIDEYIKYICSANTPYLGDDYSILIMSEELQPFYQKQKNIDEVVDIIDSRVNKMIDENK